MSALASSLTGATLGGPAGGDLTGDYPNPTFDLNKQHEWAVVQSFLEGISGDNTHILTLPLTTGTLALVGDAPGGNAGGDLTGTYPNPTIKASVTLTTPTLTSPHMTTATVDSGGLTVTAGGLKVTAGGVGVGITPVAGQAIVLHTATNHNLSVADTTNGPMIQAQNDANNASIAVLIGNGSNVVATFAPNGGLQMGAPTGGDKGAGTINAAGAYYANGTAGVAAFGPSAVTSITVKNGIITAIS